MVNKLSGEDRAAIHEAVLKAEKISGAQLAVVVTPASDEYRSFALMCGLTLGTLLGLLLWQQKILLSVPGLFCEQLAVALLWLMVPFLWGFSLRYAPARMLRRRAAQRAAEEYVHLSHHVAASTPFVLLYVSLVERYVHVYASREVRAKIPDKEWHAVVGTLTAAVKSEGVRAAVIKAVEHAGAMLKGHFPSP